MGIIRNIINYDIAILFIYQFSSFFLPNPSSQEHSFGLRRESITRDRSLFSFLHFKKNEFVIDIYKYIQGCCQQAIIITGFI
jgi:hypothetical protein